MSSTNDRTLAPTTRRLRPSKSTLFGLVLAIGIVVDDAIVVVENVERNLARGMTPKEASHVTMGEVGTAVVAISLVLIAVFAPTAFIPGISGQFYNQFAVTISVTTAISALNSLTLSPALAGILLRSHDSIREPRNIASRAGAVLANGFNTGFDKVSNGYSWIIRKLVGGWIGRTAALIVFASLLVATWFMTTIVPSGFVPVMDQGYAILVIQLPDGASLARTDEVVKKVGAIAKAVPGVRNAIQFPGFSGATFTAASNSGLVFTPFKSFKEREPIGATANKIIAELNEKVQEIEEAFIIAIPPPSVRGVGNAGGFKMQILDEENSDMTRALGLAREMMAEAASTEGLTGVFTTFSNSSPEYYLAVDRDKARYLNVPVTNVFSALSINLGTSYVNDFNAFGRVYQVRAQADRQFRMDKDAMLALKVRSAKGALVPLGTLMDPRYKRPHSCPTLQYVCLRSASRKPNSRHLDWYRYQENGVYRRQDTDARRLVRMDRTCLSGNPDRKCRGLHLCAFGHICLPGARRSVRKLGAALGNHPDRSPRRARCLDRGITPGNGQ